MIKPQRGWAPKEGVHNNNNLAVVAVNTEEDSAVDVAADVAADK